MTDLFGAGMEKTVRVVVELQFFLGFCFSCNLQQEPTNSAV